MSDTLAVAINNADKNFRNDPPRARATFVSDSRLGERFRSEVSLRSHRLVVDEPHGIGGTDAGPTPVELLLAALGTCQEITYRAFATALGIALDGVAVKVEGDIDFRGFFAIDTDIRPGFQAIRVNVEITSSASDADIGRLRAAVNQHCPVLDMLQTPVPTALTLHRSAP